MHAYSKIPDWPVLKRRYQAFLEGCVEDDSIIAQIQNPNPARPAPEPWMLDAGAPRAAPYSCMRKHAALNRASGARTIPAEVQGIRIGDCVLIAAPVEMLTEVGLRIKKASPCRHTFVVAFSNGYLHYGPPAEAYDRGGYEVAECLLAPAWQRLYEQQANRIIRRLR